MINIPLEMTKSLRIGFRIKMYLFVDGTLSLSLSVYIYIYI